MPNSRPSKEEWVRAALRKLIDATADFRVAVETDPDWRDENAVEVDEALIGARAALAADTEPEGGAGCTLSRTSS